MVCGAVASPSSSPGGEMGSCNLGQLGNGRVGSSRRGKKSSSDKQKQPQRGLGVAQLEKIRLQNEMMAGYLHSPFPRDLNKEDLRAPSTVTVTTSSSLFGAHPNIMMGFGGSTGTEIRYGELYPGATARSLNDANDLRPHHLRRPTTTLPLIEQSSENDGRRDRRHSVGSTSSQNSDTSNSSELDLELRLSL
ncbi:unnamed protein product [Musa acuminata subsp. burmannicoides]